MPLEKKVLLHYRQLYGDAIYLTRGVDPLSSDLSGLHPALPREILIYA